MYDKILHSSLLDPSSALQDSLVPQANTEEGQFGGNKKAGIHRTVKQNQVTFLRLLHKHL